MGSRQPGQEVTGLPTVNKWVMLLGLLVCRTRLLTVQPVQHVQQYTMRNGPLGVSDICLAARASRAGWNLSVFCVCTACRWRTACRTTAVSTMPDCPLYCCLCLVLQEGTVGDYQGGGTTPVQDAKLSLMRSSVGEDLQTGAKFFLVASYTGTTGFAQEGVTITGGQDSWSYKILLSCLLPAACFTHWRPASTAPHIFLYVSDTGQPYHLCVAATQCGTLLSDCNRSAMQCYPVVSTVCCVVSTVC